MPVAGIRAGAPARPADLVLRNARIFTGDPRQPAATALAVRNGAVAVIGGGREVAPLVGLQTRVIDALVPLRSGHSRLERTETLASHTVGGARLTGEQDVKGILSPGYYADFAVLSDDFFEIPEERIPEIAALLTAVGGRVVHAVGFFEGLAPAAPLVQPDCSPIAHFGGCQAGHASGRSGPRQAEGIRDTAAESAEHLRWRQRTGRATDGHRPLDTFDPCFS
ncbi:amidohydrolase family protein [Streptomyces mirabilis]|uniref:amidohydrolase family protein n=1 Tax=Streptomyces mirabilis TaxID=68239 RepID=UPI00365C00BF